MQPNILFVDDEPRLLAGLCRAMRDQPFLTLTAHSGEEAKQILISRTISVIVSDDNMKGMKGTEFLSWVAENFPNVVRIMLTGQPDVPSMQAAINDAQVFRYLTKPVKDFDLAMTIHDALESISSSPSAAFGSTATN